MTTVAIDGRVMATRVLAWDPWAALLRSPYQGTEWLTVRQRAHEWSESALVQGEVGLHGVHFEPDARPWLPQHVVAHVLCSGRIVLAARSHALRAEEMELVGLTVVERTLAAPLWRRYGVPVRVMRPVKTGRVVMLDEDGTVIVRRYRDGELVERQQQ